MGGRFFIIINYELSTDKCDGIDFLTCRYSASQNNNKSGGRTCINTMLNTPRYYKGFLREKSVNY